MNRILCVDNSGSTSGSTAYWELAHRIYQQTQPQRLIFWNSEAQLCSAFQLHSTGCTQPQSFIALLQNESEPYDLIITTDGEISDCDIEKCGTLVSPEFLSLVNSTVIHYIGSERSMNIGLNVIFGRTKKMSYHINERIFDQLYDKFEKLDLDQFMSPNFAISLIVKIKNIEATYSDQTRREAHISELRGEVCRLYSRLEHESLDASAADKLEEFYKNDQMREFVDALARDRLDVQSVSRQKSVILNMFDRKIDFNISRITAAATIQEQVVEAPEEESAWSEFEDLITLDPFSLPCLLVQTTDTPLITDKTLLKHPFKLLSEPEIINKIMRLIEPNPIDYTTYQRLAFDEQGDTVSPYTRARCKGVFLFDTVNMKCVKNNCRAISVMFGDQNKVPGNLVIWNLVVMYLLYRYKLEGTPYKSVMLEQIRKYCGQFSASLSITHQCQVLRRAKIEVCLWYCLRAAPTICPNTARNVLRSPFGLELFQFYYDVFGHDGDEYLTALSLRTRRWSVWNYLLVNKGRSDLYLETRAQHQNYCMHNDCIVLLAGKCEIPFMSKCNILDADSVSTLFANLTDSSSKVDDIEGFDVVPARVDCADLDGIAEEMTHVEINIKTCWPLVICPVTGLHWKVCVGDYDVKTESHLRLFNIYCTKYKMYPKVYMDLALLYSRRVKNCVLKKRDLNSFQYVFGLFTKVMATYACEEYLSIYARHTDERERLLKEDSKFKN